MRGMNDKLMQALDMAIAKDDIDNICENRTGCKGCPLDNIESGGVKICDLLNWHDIGHDIAVAWREAKEKADQ